MIAKPKKPTRTAMKHKCDILASKYYRALTPYCEAAGLDSISCGGTLQWAHLIGRATLHIRYESFNNLILCAGHHIFFTHHPISWVRFLEANFPERLNLAEYHKNVYGKVDYDFWVTRFSTLPDSQKQP